MRWIFFGITVAMLVVVGATAPAEPRRDYETPKKEFYEQVERSQRA
jgi:hypothetical protein